MILNGENYLKKNNIKNYKLDTELIMSKAINKSREFIFLNNNKNLNHKELREYQLLLNRRSKKEPIAYIINEKEFWKNKFYVDKNVLIPRPDSEILIEKILKLYKKKSNISILILNSQAVL